MHLDPTNRVVAPCAAGMAVKREPEEARAAAAQAAWTPPRSGAHTGRD